MFKKWTKADSWRGLAAGVFMGYWVYYANGDLSGAWIAALKQGIYSFFAAYAIVSLLKAVIKDLDALRISYIVLRSTIIVSLITIGLTAIVHWIRGTPDFSASIAVSVYITPPSLAILAWLEVGKHRKEAE